MIEFICPGGCCCGYTIRVPDEAAGRVVACPRSSQRVRVPDGPMTEAKWLRCRAPAEMLRLLPAPVSARQLLLFEAACCRHVEHLLEDRDRPAVEAVERHADGLLTPAEFHATATEIFYRYRAGSVAASAAAGDGPSFRLPPAVAALGALLSAARPANPAVAAGAALSAATADPTRNRADEEAALAGLLRDVLGNPYRPALLAVDWLTWDAGAAARIARTIYDEKRFDEMPVLGDALEDAGCTDAAILDHCRGPGPHIRGCWLLDLILGKE